MRYWFVSNVIFQLIWLSHDADSGVPPKEVVDRLHAAGIPVMNMIGHPKHIAKALEAGVDIFCAQGGEGGGHTGDIPFSVRHFGGLAQALLMSRDIPFVPSNPSTLLRSLSLRALMSSRVK